MITSAEQPVEFQRHVVVAAMSDPRGNPRPNRLLTSLTGRVDTTFFGPGGVPDDRIEFIEYHPRVNTRFRRAASVLRGQVSAEMAAREFSLEDLERLAATSADVVVCEDIRMMPILRQALPHAHLTVDLREYYPQQFQQNFRWRLIRGRELHQLVAGLHTADQLWVVSPTLQRLYKSRHGLDTTLVMSLPRHHPRLAPAPQERDRVRLVHHGVAKPVRSLELMIEAAHLASDHVTLDLMLVEQDRAYLEDLRGRAASSDTVSILDPVAFDDIVPTLNAYDAGVCFFPPITPNLEAVLPNKFFEFIQARLAVVCGPSPDLRTIVEQYDLGLITDNFSVEALARAFRQLAESGTDRFKQNADRASAILSHEANEPMLFSMLGV